MLEMPKAFRLQLLEKVRLGCFSVIVANSFLMEVIKWFDFLNYPILVILPVITNKVVSI